MKNSILINSSSSNNNNTNKLYHETFSVLSQFETIINNRCGSNTFTLTEVTKIYHQAYGLGFYFNRRYLIHRQRLNVINRGYGLRVHFCDMYLEK